MKKINLNNQDNKRVNSIKKEASDEWCTPYDVIEKELRHYIKDFANKIIYLPCDNPLYSNFFKYFYDNFKAFKLRGLIATYLDTKNPKRTDVSLKNGQLNTLSTPIKGNGSFASAECLNIMLTQADIIITNPPFSLLRKLIDLLRAIKRKFIILAPYTCIDYKVIFQPFKKEELWLGVNDASIYFHNPHEDKVKRVGILWLQNFRRMRNYNYDFKYHSLKEAPHLVLDNNVINFQSYRDVPDNFYRHFYAPISMLFYFDYDTFEIVNKPDRATFQGQELFKRVCFKRKGQKVEVVVPDNQIKLW